MGSSKLIVPFFIRMKGCIYNCIYCNQYAFIEPEVDENIHRVVERYLNFSKKYESVELAFYGGTFLNLPEKTIAKLLEEARNLKDKGLINSIRISTTPDSITYKKANFIKGIVNTVEIGVQTIDDRILRLLKRKYNMSLCLERTLLLREMGFNLGYQLMVGLPTQTYTSFMQTINTVCLVKPNFVRIYPLVVLKNTPLENYLRLNVVNYPDLDFILNAGAYALFQFYKKGIKVIKVGLTEFFDESEVYRGYMVKNWRIEMESVLWRSFLAKLVTDIGNQKVIIKCSCEDYDAIIGINKRNWNYFYRLGYELEVLRSNNLTRFVLELGNEKYTLLEANFMKEEVVLPKGIEKT
ncbi:MAG: radical SAM protein [Proteobacteria bacterium]|nr:radical SAM protein [Pseudomonadota bacterium]